MSEPIVFSKTVQPICISSTSVAKNKTYVNEAALVSGWGNLMEEFATGKYTRPDETDFSLYQQHMRSYFPYESNVIWCVGASEKLGTSFDS